MLQRVADAARERMRADVVGVNAVNPITGAFHRARALSGALREEHDSESRPRVGGLASRVLQDGELFVPDLHLAPEHASPFTEAEGIRAIAATSVMSPRHRHPLAVLYVDYRTPRDFTPELRAQLVTLREWAAALLETTWLLRRYREVQRIGQEVNEHLGTEADLLGRIHRHAGGILDTSHFVVLGVCRPETGSLDLWVSREGRAFDHARMPAPAACLERATAEDARLVRRRSEEADQLPSILHGPPCLAEPVPESVLFVALVLRGVPLGFLSVQHEAADEYDAEDLHLLQHLGNHVALALSNMRLFGNLERLNRVGELLSRRQVEGDVVDVAVDVVREEAGATFAEVHLHDPGGLRLRVTAGPDLPPEARPRLDGLLARSLVEEELVSETVEAVPPSLVAVPLRFAELSLGALVLGFTFPQRFDAPQRQLVDGLARHVAAAVQHANAFESARSRRAVDLRALATIDEAIGPMLDLDVVLHAILVGANERVGAVDASILLHDAEEEELRTAAAIGPNETASRKTPISLEKSSHSGITRWVFENRSAARILDLPNEAAWRTVHRPLAKGVVTRSELDVPILDGDRCIGVLNFESPTAEAFGREEEDFLRALAPRAALAIQRAQDHERQRRLTQELEALREIAENLVAELDPGRLFVTILEKALRLTESKSGQLFRRDEETGRLNAVHEIGVPDGRQGDSLDPGEGIVGLAADEARTYNIDIRDYPDRYRSDIPDVRWELAVPLRLGGRVLGVVNIERKRKKFSTREERLLERFATLAVLALQNAERYESVETERHKLAVLREVDEAIIAQRDDPGGVMRYVLEKAVALGTASAGRLHVLRGERVSLALAARRRGKSLAVDRIEPEALPPAQPFPDLVAEVVATGAPVVRKNPGAVAVPLLDEGKTALVGVLDVTLRREAVVEDVIGWLELLAGQAVIAIQNARHTEEARNALGRMRLLNDAAQPLARVADMEKVEGAWRAVEELLRERTGGQMVIRRHEVETDKLVAIWPRRLPKGLSERMEASEGLSAKLSAEKPTFVVPDVRDPPPGLAPSLPMGAATRALILTRVAYGERFYGTLSLHHPRPYHFGDVDLAMVEGVAHLLAVTFQRLESTRWMREAEMRATAAEVMGSIGEQAFALAHRLGNDLGTVPSSVDFVRDALAGVPGVPGSVATDLTEIETHAKRVLDLTSRLKLDLAQFREEGAQREPSVVAVSDLLQHAEQDARDPARTRQVRLTFPEARAVPAVRVVFDQIGSCLGNVIGNALEAAPSGGSVDVAVEVRPAYVAVLVRDDGAGIPPQSREKIFDLLYSTKESSGFGLWSARRNALANGGDLSLVRSGPGDTVFELLLRRAEGA